jgi:3-methylcrotonyl-CoA carboxylase alpha subunit
LYAEDPANGFLPSVGVLEHFRLRGPRIETGVEEGDQISSFYDPMIAKLVAHSPDRDEAISDLEGLCAIADVWPVKTNAGFLAKLLWRPEFRAAEINTNFIGDHLEELVAKPEISEDALDAATHLLVGERGGSPLSCSGFRLNAPAKQSVRLLIDGEALEAPLPTASSPANYWGRATTIGGTLIKFDAGYAYVISLDHPRGTGTTHGLHDGEIEAPMPGKVTAVEVSKGEKVAKGQRLLTLEAMKMEHALTAPFDGTVAELNASAGAQVTEGQMLVRVEAPSSPAKAGAQDSA